jgi:hypothetical protein
MGPSKRKVGSRRKVLNRLSVQRVHVNRGGYDPGGRYWGVGSKLYLVEDQDFTASTYVRAKDAGEARIKGAAEIDRQIARERGRNADTGG